MIKELSVEENALLKYSSFYAGKLMKGLKHDAALAKLEEKIKKQDPKKAQVIAQEIKQSIIQINNQLQNTDKWVKALEVSLKQAKQIVETDTQ